MAFDKVIDSVKLDAALTETANSIRAKTGGTEPITWDELEGFKTAVDSIDTETIYDRGYEDGKNSVVPVERYAKLIRLPSLNIFGTSEAVLNLDGAQSLERLFHIESEDCKNTTVEHLTINCSNLVTSFNRAMHAGWYDYTLKRLTLNLSTENTTSFTYAFSGCRALEIIDGMPFDFTSMTAAPNIFQQCAALTDFRVVEKSIKIKFDLQYCLNLSNETIQSVIDGLADLTGGTAQTLDFYSDVVDKLTAEQYTEILNKNWSVT